MKKIYNREKMKSFFLSCLLISTFTSAFGRTKSSERAQKQISETVNEARTWNTLDGKPSLLVAHRGERAFSLPEHSLPGYHMAAWEHADYVEPDLVMTKDGHIVCYHDLSLKSNTDVATRPEFADRKRNMTVEDIPGSMGLLELNDDWFIMDFTLEELKTIRLNVNPRGKRNMRLPFFDGQFSIPTFDEYLQLIKNVSSLTGRRIGIIPEIKHSRVHWKNLNPDKPFLFEKKVLSKFHKYGFLDEDGRVASGHMEDIVIQTFDISSARFLRTQNKYISILLLVRGNVEVLTPQGLKSIAPIVTHIGPYKPFYTIGVQKVIDTEFKNTSWLKPNRLKKLGGLIGPKDLASEVRKHKIRQMPFTFYSSYEFDEKEFEPKAAQQPSPPGLDSEQLDQRRAELFHFFQLGMDGLFVENINEALLLREEFAHTMLARNSTS